jgi:hypothetical protein
MKEWLQWRLFINVFNGRVILDEEYKTEIFICRRINMEISK